MGGLFAVAGEGGVFQFAAGGGVIGFVFGVAEVGRAFQRMVEEVGQGSHHRGCCRRMMLKATVEVPLPAGQRSK